VPPLTLLAKQVVERHQARELDVLRAAATIEHQQLFEVSTASHNAEPRRRYLHQAVNREVCPLCPQAWHRQKMLKLRLLRSQWQERGAPHPWPCRDGPACTSGTCCLLQGEEKALVAREQAAWRQQVAARAASVSSQEAHLKQSHTEVLDMAEGAVSRAVPWNQCAGPIVRGESAGTCGNLFSCMHRHVHRRLEQESHPGAGADPRGFCLCDARNDLCEGCLPCRDRPCAMCDELFCRKCYEEHHSWCARRNRDRCGLTKGQSRTRRFAAGHCRRDTDGAHKCSLCSTISCEGCLRFRGERPVCQECFAGRETD
jgi:hypothetical protein